MLISNGIDIIETERIKKAIKNKKFLKRIFTAKELEYIKKRKENVNTISGMFAAKEAVSKALGRGIRDFSFKNIIICHDKYGKPIVKLTDNAESVANEENINSIKLSITHINEYALASVIATKEKNIVNEDKNFYYLKDILPKRNKRSHKGNYGRIGIIAGSKGMTGASYLTSTSSLKSGGGIVYALIPESLNNILESKTVEIITKPITDNNKGHFILSSIKEVKKLIENYDALAIGPGIGVDIERTKFIKKILKDTKKTIVLDADGLNCISKEADILLKRKDETVITPHPGELSRLLDKSISEIQNNREKYAKETSKKFNVITVLKGSETIITNKKGETFINNTGNPGMATAGSGDVLTGLITSFIAQGISPYNAAILGVYLHGLAGDIAALDKGEYGLTAMDIIDNIPYAIKLME
ncbi:MAG: NAD(P)H-hydrate dehydratase [Firmicutes bacterium]|nr:NAD(P)H-hydrate dehydratase [Bacillota bacterium]